MPAFEDIINKILKTRNFWQKCVIGGLLCFIPILNLCAFGYIYKYLEQLQVRAEFELPEWESWDLLFINGIKMMIVGLLFFIFPVLLLQFFIYLMGIITFGLMNLVGWAVIAMVLLLVPLLFSCALYQYQRFGRWQVFLEFHKCIPLLKRSAPHLCLPVFSLWGLWILGLPLYGFSCFVGLLLFLSYSMIVFSMIDKRS